MIPISNEELMSEGRLGGGVNAALAKACSHPLRYRILIIASKREITPTEIAETLGEAPERVRYHVRRLHKDGLMELVGEDRRRGGIQRIYRATVPPIIDTATAELLPRLVREEASAAIVNLIFDDIKTSIEGQAFDGRPERTVMRYPIVADAEGFRQVAELMEETIDKISAIEAGSVDRLARRGKEGFKVSTALMAFDVPPTQK